MTVSPRLGALFMSAPTFRLMLRHTRFVARSNTCRYASTTSETVEAASNTAAKSKEAASKMTSKASEGLSRVTSSAGPALSGAAQRVNRALNRVGGRTGRLIAFGRSLIPPTIYYSKVGFELSKLVIRGQKMGPPPIEAFQSYLTSFAHIARNPTAFFSISKNNANSINIGGILNQIRDINTQKLASLGIITAEVLGLFTVGEIIGRFKFIGYRGDLEHH